MEWQVANFELSKTLMELMGSKESEFVWHDSELAGKQLLRRSAFSFNAQTYDILIPAYTVAELGDLLLWDRVHFVRSSNDSGWLSEYSWGDGDFKAVADTEADSRAKLLIHLLESKLIPSSEGAR